MQKSKIKAGDTVRYLVTRSNVVVHEVRNGTKDTFGDVLIPATVVFKTSDGTFFDNLENFEAVRGVDEYEERFCSNPTCRGRRASGKGFSVRVLKSTVGNVECSECFSR